MDIYCRKEGRGDFWLMLWFIVKNIVWTKMSCVLMQGKSCMKNETWQWPPWPPCSYMHENNHQGEVKDRSTDTFHFSLLTLIQSHKYKLLQSLFWMTRSIWCHSIHKFFFAENCTLGTTDYKAPQAIRGYQFSACLSERFRVPKKTQLEYSVIIKLQRIGLHYSYSALTQ